VSEIHPKSYEMVISNVIPAKAGIYPVFNVAGILDARLRGHDAKSDAVVVTPL